MVEFVDNGVSHSLPPKENEIKNTKIVEINELNIENADIEQPLVIRSQNENKLKQQRCVWNGIKVLSIQGIIQHEKRETLFHIITKNRIKSWMMKFMIILQNILKLFLQVIICQNLLVNLILPLL